MPPSISEPSFLSQESFELVEGENLLTEGMGMRWTNVLKNSPCHLRVTTHRIVLCDKSIGLAVGLFGPIGAAVSSIRKQTKINCQIPISDIAGLTKVAHGFSKRYKIASHSGKTYPDIGFSFMEIWEAKFRELGISIVVE